MASRSWAASWQPFADPLASGTKPALSKPRTADRDHTITVALVIPLSGPAGLFGPTCELCATLAVEELTRANGILGKTVRLTVVDGGRPPAAVAAEVATLVNTRAIDAVVGWHISAVRTALTPLLAGRVPYIYTALYEGGERTPGVFLTGEIPSRQIKPAMRWLRETHAARRWYIIGNDYIWPHLSAAAACRYAKGIDATVCEQTFVPLGTTQFDRHLRRIDHLNPDAVLILLVGDDSIYFNRAFARYGLDSYCLRFSPLMEENMVLAIGADATAGLYTAAGFFETLITPESLDFSGRYAGRFGANAPPLNSLGESCYEGIQLLAALTSKARSLDPARLCPAAENVDYEGPRGHLHVRSSHIDQRIYLAEADGLDLLVTTEL